MFKKKAKTPPKQPPPPTHPNPPHKPEPPNQNQPPHSDPPHQNLHPDQPKPSPHVEPHQNPPAHPNSAVSRPQHGPPLDHPNPPPPHPQPPNDHEHPDPSPHDNLPPHHSKPPPNSGSLPPSSTTVVGISSSEGNVGTERKEPEKKHESGGHICKGILWLFLLLFYHFLGYFMTMALGIGIGIFSAIVHYNFWYKELDAFWQMYITLVFVSLVTELYFRMMSKTKFTKWMNKTQQEYLITLYYVPRCFYFSLYILTVISLFLQYRGVHQEAYIPTNSSLLGPVTPKSPLLLEMDDDHYFRTILFVMSLSFMVYTLTKESDWATHRLRIMAAGDDDPIGKGSIGSFIVLIGAHVILTLIYCLPIVGFIFVFKTFVAGWEETYFIICPLAALIGIFASFLERQNLFPQIPMKPPDYAYENHLRIRVGFLHYWLIPLCAGRYFNHTKSVKYDATDGDFLVFTLQVAIGVLQASKVIANDVYLVFFVPKPENVPREESVQFPEDDELYHEYDDEEDELSMPHLSPDVRSVQEFDHRFPPGLKKLPNSDNNGLAQSQSDMKTGEDSASVHDIMKRLV